MDDEDTALGLEAHHPPLRVAVISHGLEPGSEFHLIADAAGWTQLEQLDWRLETKPGKVADPAAWLVAAIRNGHAAPKGFVSKAERQRREEARQAQQREKVEERRR